jgi:methylglutaconyl-CoA hydratase
MSSLLAKLDGRGVLTLSLNRPEVHNAFDADLVAEITRRLEEAGRQPQVRLVVMTGIGSSFSAGADLRWMRAMAAASEQENEGDALRLAAMLRTLNYLERPTVARVNGPTFGGGLGLVACCDITVAAESASFGLTEARLGLAPAVISPYVMRRIGEGNARRYFQSGERFDAHRAEALGLLQQVVPDAALDSTVAAIIDQLLQSGPEALVASKRLVFSIAGHDRDSQRRLDQHTAGLIARLRVSAEGQEGLNAFLEKRPPCWAGE